MSEYKIATTEQLVEANELAKVRKYNREVPDEVLERLAPTGVHVCYFVMDHEHARGVLVDPHYRTCWRAYLADAYIIDIQMDWDRDLFDNLPSVNAESYKRFLGDNSV